MDTNINHAVVGAFVILLTIATVLGIIWLSSGFSVAQYSTYQIYMQESVTGLNIDSGVEYNGVNVGSVQNIELNHNNPQLVELLVNIKNGTPITKGTVATLATKGLTGLTFLALKDDSSNLQPLVAERGQTYPVIKTAPSIFVRLDTALSELSTNLQKVATSIQSILDKDNQKSIKQTLANLSKISSMLEKQTLYSTDQLLFNLNDLTQSLSTVTEEVKQNPSILIRGSNPPLLGPGEK